MVNIRRAHFAGSFYPSDSGELLQQVNRFLDKTRVEFSRESSILGVVVPHAGYVYSGECAAYAYNVLKERDFDLAVLIGPSHRSNDFYFSVGDFERYDTPLGGVNVDRVYTKELLEDSKFDFSPNAHLNEHSLEVQIPFLQVIKPKAKILPILIGRQGNSSSEYLAVKLAKLFSERIDRTVFIVSTDLSHYHDSSLASEMDLQIAKALEDLDGAKILRLLTTNKAEACGYGGLLTILNLARELGFNKAKNLHYTHSGKAFGDNTHVVGYLSSVFYNQLI